MAIGPRFPHGPSSRAVLIGSSKFRTEALPPIPAVRDNLEALRHALTHPDHGLLAPQHCRVLPDPDDQRAVGDALEWASREASDLLLVYYAGHGLLDEDGRLHLALVGTDPARVGFTAVPLELIKRDVARAPAKARILLLDCCFSGRAVAAMAEPQSVIAGQLDFTGTYTLTSTTPNAPSHAPPGDRYTAFTGALLHALSLPQPLTLDEVYTHIDHELFGLGLPRPQRRTVNAVGDLALVKGPVDADRARTTPVDPADGEIVFAKAKRSRLHNAWIGLVGLATLLALLFSFFGHAEPLLPCGLLSGLYLVSTLGRYTYKLLLDREGVVLRDGQLSHRIPWQDIEYLGILQRDPHHAEITEILLIRLRPHALDRLDMLAGPAGLPHWMFRLGGSDFRTLGYINFCSARDIGTFDHALDTAIEQFAGRPMFRNSRELIDHDARLAPHR
ncbi:caspase domain-containing protein [Kitasatospora sp. NPDC127067]|uniref:caspase family protein n=1 Tax=Kitasatospora sp. NPDC127067 TaxID=3347126 RepID=UPI003662ECCC